MLRRLLAVPLLGALATAALLLSPALASADTSSQLTIVGTSDVSDSGLIPNLIGPEFEQAFPQFSFRYIGSATLAAISSAESGAQGASMLIVHAASLENQFVASGFSYQNAYGHAIFRNDFVLAGDSADPADVLTNDPHNVVQAFADIATAGVNGGGSPKATFLSRGGGAGTTVEEHEIWSQVVSQGLAPTGVFFCALSSSVGGFDSPIAPGNGVTANGQECPSSGAIPSGAELPSWYQITGLSQAPNVVAANACTGVSSPVGTSCYVLTDRGTYDYLESGEDPTGVSSNPFFSVPNLEIVTRDDSASAPGGADELINYFHAYIINPTPPSPAPALQVNLTAAQDFMNFVTSPTVQAQLKNYLSHNTGNDPQGAPFVADASPSISAGWSSSNVAAGKSVTVAGQVTNNEIGYPEIGTVPVAVDELVAGLPVAIAGATSTTAANGNYSITFTPPSNGQYEVSTQQISKVENSTLSPVFGDILSPGASSPDSITVRSSIKISSDHPSAGGLSVTGSVTPAALDNNATVALLVRPKGSTGSFREIGVTSLVAKQSAFAVTGNMKPGQYTVEVRYNDPGEIAGTTAVLNVNVPSGSTTVKFTSATVKNGALTVTGTLSQAPNAAGAKVELLGERTAPLKTIKATRASIAAAAAAGFPVIAKTSVAKGKTTFTIKTKLTRGFKWALELEYVNPTQATSYSQARTVSVR
jgi:tungstate transport system substrate-binding protein